MNASASLTVRMLRLFARRDGRIEIAIERIVAKHADHDRLLLARECGGRPLDELREIEQEHGLDLVIAHRRRVRERRKQREQHRDDGRPMLAARRPDR